MNKTDVSCVGGCAGMFANGLWISQVVLVVLKIFNLIQWTWLSVFWPSYVLIAIIIISLLILWAANEL